MEFERAGLHLGVRKRFGQGEKADHPSVGKNTKWTLVSRSNIEKVFPAEITHPRTRRYQRKLIYMTKPESVSAERVDGLGSQTISLRLWSKREIDVFA